MKILSVDENAENLDLIEAIGRAHGFDVASVRNGLEALEELQKQPYDLIVSDIPMLEMDGFELCHEVKIRARTRHIPFIFYSSTHAAKQDEDLALLLGASRYLVKPVEPDKFKTIIEEVVSQAQGAGASDEEAELKGTVDYLNAYNARLVAKLDHQIEQLETATKELQASIQARDSEIAQRRRAEEELRFYSGELADTNKDLRRAREEINASRRMLQLVLDTIPLGVFWKDRDGRYLGCNRRFLTDCGLSAQDDIVGRADSEMPWKEQAEIFREEDREVMETGQPRIGYDKPAVGADGVRRRLRGCKVPLLGPTGGVIGVLGTHEDITERKQAEEELRGSEERYGMLFDTMIEGFCVIEVVFDGDGKPIDYRFLEVNPAFEARTGLKHARGRLMRELVPDHEAHWFEIYGQVALTGQPARFVNEARALNRWYDVSAYRLGGPESRRVAILFNDITERKRVEETLRESQEGFRSVVENAPEAIIVSTQGCFRYLNRPAVRLLGAASDTELLNRPLTEGVHPDSRAALAEAVRQVQERRGTIIPVAQKYLRRDGAVLDIEGSIVPFFYGGEQGALILVRDVTERKRAEDELRAKEDLLSESQRIAHLGGWEWTVQAGTSALVWTPETYRLFGVFPDAFVPSPETFGNLVHPDDRTAIQGWMSACLAGLEPPDLEFRVCLPDGSVRYMNGRGHVVAQNAENRRIRMVGVVQDITESKIAEEKVRRYSVQLAETNEDLKRFTQIVSHDLRAPLVNLQGFCTELRHSIDTLRKPGEALLANLPDADRAAAAQALEQTIPEALGFIESSVTRIDHLTAALLRLSRAGRRELHKEELDAGALLQDIVGSLAHQIEGRNIAFEIGPLPRITSDRAAVKQIFANLLDNAIKYSDPQRPGRIGVSAVETEDAVVFRVRDTGRGIAEEDMGKIFQPFRRAGAQDVPGEGMGLAFVQMLLHRLGGRIEGHSQLGVGTTFSFLLPKGELD